MFFLNRELFFINLPDGFSLNGAIVLSGQSRLSDPVMWIDGVIFGVIVIERDASISKHAQFLIGERARNDVVVPENVIVIVIHLKKEIL